MRRTFGHIQEIVAGELYRVYWSDHGTKRSHRVHGTRKDAELYLARVQVSRDGMAADWSLSDYWRVGVKPTFATLSERTIYDYTRLWAVELQPRLGDYMLSAITWRVAETALAGVSSPIVQRDAYRLLRKILNLAVRDGIITHNPVAQGIKLKPYRKRDKDIYTREQVLDILTGAVGFKHYPLILLEVGGGLRHEEACAVTQADVTRLDVGGRVYAAVTVSKALTSVNSKKVLKETKTGFSARVAILGAPFALPLLGMRSRLPQDANRQASPVTITRNFKRYATNNNLPYIPFGNMRTNYSMLHAEAGSLDSLVSLSMGHSDGTTRGRNYMRQTQAGLVLIADNLADYLLS